MSQLNGVYTQRFNRRYGRVCHVFQGRYKAISLDKESYLLELVRYIVLNPVRAGMVRTAKDWPWSSYRATAGWLKAAPWLQTDWRLSAFCRERKTACEHYRAFVSEGRGQPSPWENLKNQVFLGSEQFVTDMQGLIDPEKTLEEIPQGQKRVHSKPLSDYKRVELAEYFGLYYSSVSKIIRGVENSRFKTCPLFWRKSLGI